MTRRAPPYLRPRLRSHINRGLRLGVELRSGGGQRGRPLNARAICVGQVLDLAYRPLTLGRQLRSRPDFKTPRRSPRRLLDQAVTGGLRFWRERRLRGVLSPVVVVVVVDPGLRPRFFSVLPTPAKFRSR